MSRIISSRSRSAASAALVLLVACLWLAACGGSSSSSSTSTAANTSTTASTTTKGGAPAIAKRFTAVRECLQKNGITLPKRTPGQRAPGGLLGSGGGPQLPKGVTRAQYEAAIKKCGGFGGGRFGAGGGGGRLNSPAFRAALTKFAACMRENGVNVPAPNTSGKGPVFNTNGLNAASAKFKAAQTKCASVLRGLLKAQPGGTGAPPASAG